MIKRDEEIFFAVTNNVQEPANYFALALCASSRSKHFDASTPKFMISNEKKERKGQRNWL